MQTSNIEYYQKRMVEEARQAARETDRGLRHIHETLANMYRARIDEVGKPAANSTGQGAQREWVSNRLNA